MPCDEAVQGEVFILMVFKDQGENHYRAAEISYASSSLLTQPGNGTVRTWPPLPTRSTMAQCSSRRCK